MYKKECINCDFEVYYHNIIPQYKTVKHYTYTHAVHNKTTISLNSSILKKLKTPESSFIHKSLMKVALFAE